MNDNSFQNYSGQNGQNGQPSMDPAGQTLYPQFQDSGQPMVAPTNPVYPQKKSSSGIVIAVVVGVIALVLGFVICKLVTPSGDNVPRPSNTPSQQQTPQSESASSNDSVSTVVLDGKELRDNYNEVNYKQFIGKKITLTNILATINDDGDVLLSGGGLLSFFLISCDNISGLGLANNEWYTLTGILSSNTTTPSYYYLSNCVATKQ